LIRIRGFYRLQAKGTQLKLGGEKTVRSSFKLTEKKRGGKEEGREVRETRAALETISFLGL